MAAKDKSGPLEVVNQLALFSPIGRIYDLNSPSNYLGRRTRIALWLGIGRKRFDVVPVLVIITEKRNFVSCCCVLAQLHDTTRLHLMPKTTLNLPMRDLETMRAHAHKTTIPMTYLCTIHNRCTSDRLS